MSRVEPSPKLAPAQKALPWAAKTTARIWISSSKLSKAAAISLINGISKKLFGGRRISTKATWPLFSMPISLIRVSPLLGSRATPCRLHGALDDQGVHHGDTIALGVHNYGIKIDFSNVVRVIECELREFNHEIRQCLGIGRRHATIRAKDNTGFQAVD